MVCSKVDSSNQINMEGGGTDNRAGQDTNLSPTIDILTPEGKTIKLSIGDNNTEIRRIKTDCELLCGVPSDLQQIQLQGRDLNNDSTISSLGLSDGCTLILTVPQWWQKFVSTCYKGDTQQVRKRIYVKMSQISREERSFTAAFIAAVKGNHNLMFAAFAGRKINLHSKTTLSGRNLLHAAVSGGSTSCVANILMNGGNALLEAPDNTEETPVRMAKKLYGEAGDMVKFLNVYLELHQRETKHSHSPNGYWDNLEKNNNNSDVISADNRSNNDDENHSQSDENLITELGDLSVNQEEPSRTNFTETEFFTNSYNQGFPSVSKVNIEDYDAKTGRNSLGDTSNGSSNPDKRHENNDNPIHLRCSEQGCGQTNDTGYYSSGNQSIGKDGTEMFWNEDLFTQRNVPSTEPELTKQELNLGEQTKDNEDEDAANNLSILAAGPPGDRDSGSSRWTKPRRRAQLRFLEQRRKRSTTEKPNVEQLMAMDSNSVTNESRDKEQTEDHPNEAGKKGQNTESRDKDSHAIAPAGDVENVLQSQDSVPTVSISSNRDSSADNCHSPKPLRRAQLRKKSIIEQRRKRSMVERPNLEELDIGERKTESRTSDNLEGNAEGTTTGNFEQKPEHNTIASDNLERNTEQNTRGIIDQQPERNTRRDYLERGQCSINVERHNEGSKMTVCLDDESPVSAKYVLRLWQDQAQEAAALSGDESDTGRSPKLLRRAFLRKQAFVEQRRKKSATERPNIIKLNRGENAVRDANELASEDKSEDEPSTAKNGTSDSDTPGVTEFSQDKETFELSSQLPPKGKNKERTPIRVTQRCSNTGPLLGTHAKKTTRPISWSSVSGEESEGSDHEKVVAETIAPITRSAKTQRRRRLPLLPDKRIKLPVIKIEESGMARGSATIKAPHPPLCRTRSGSTCSEDSVSSVELPSDRAR